VDELPPISYASLFLRVGPSFGGVGQILGTFTKFVVWRRMTQKIGLLVGSLSVTSQNNYHYHSKGIQDHELSNKASALTVEWLDG